NGGTFVNPSLLPIGEPCCDNGANIVWSAAQPGQVAAGKSFLRVFDTAPGADGIPACTGDNSLLTNGVDACDQKLGLGAPGPKTDPNFNSGLDDVALTGVIAGPGAVPTASARAKAVWDCSVPPIPTFNEVFSTTYRDHESFAPANDDGMAKLNVSYCP